VLVGGKRILCTAPSHCNTKFAQVPHFLIILVGNWRIKQYAMQLQIEGFKKYFAFIKNYNLVF
jgi:hypothetical protein